MSGIVDDASLRHVVSFSVSGRWETVLEVLACIGEKERRL